MESTLSPNQTATAIWSGDVPDHEDVHRSARESTLNREMQRIPVLEY